MHPAPQRTVGTWSGREVDAAAVQSQLTHLWRVLADQARRNGEPVAARTNISTLVAYAAGTEQRDLLVKTIGDLVEHHPSRTILLAVESGAGPPSLAADVVTSCQIDRPHVCHEEILLTARGAAVEQVSSAVASLLLRDLPTYLWWPEDLTVQPALWRQLVELCDGVVVDGTRFRDVRESLEALKAGLEVPRLAVVQDIAWARLADWREMTARFFDRASARPFLQAIAAVQVITSGEDAHASAWLGMLYIAWLASRLDWQPAPLMASGATGFQLTPSSAGRPVAVEIRAGPGEGIAHGEVIVVRIRASIEGRIARFEVARRGTDAISMTAEEAGQPPLEYTLHLPPLTDSAALARLLGSVHRDRAYEDALRWLGTAFAQQGIERATTA